MIPESGFLTGMVLVGAATPLPEQACAAGHVSAGCLRPMIRIFNERHLDEI